MVSAVATLDPEIAAKTVHAATVATPMPPGRWRSSVCAAPNRSSTTLPRIMKCAISVNSGIDTSR